MNLEIILLEFLSSRRSRYPKEAMLGIESREPGNSGKYIRVGGAFCQNSNPKGGFQWKPQTLTLS